MTRAAIAERRAELHRVLDEALAWPPEYASELSNHLPMALHALSELGASASRMRQFAERYLERFAGRGGGSRASRVADWLPLRGQADAYPSLRVTFEDALARDGRDAVLRRVLPALWTGVAAAAFHGVIRTGHAAQAGHDGELAAALAYWAWRWQPLSPPSPGAAIAAADWWQRLLAASHEAKPEGRLISHRMDRAARSRAYLELAGRLHPEPDTMANLWAFAAGCYADTGNFTVLHMVTGVRAVQVLLPWIDDPDAALREVLHAFAAATLAAAVPARPLPPMPALDWPEIVARALASDDDHVVKLVHASRSAEQLGIPGRFRDAAARAVG